MPSGSTIPGPRSLWTASLTTEGALDWVSEGTVGPVGPSVRRRPSTKHCRQGGCAASSSPPKFGDSRKMAKSYHALCLAMTDGRTSAHRQECGCGPMGSRMILSVWVREYTNATRTADRNRAGDGECRDPGVLKLQLDSIPRPVLSSRQCGLCDPLAVSVSCYGYLQGAC